MSVMVTGAVASGAPSGGGPYFASAVTFDGSTWLTCDALNSGTDSGELTVAGWVKVNPAVVAQLTLWCAIISEITFPTFDVGYVGADTTRIVQTTGTFDEDRGISTIGQTDQAPGINTDWMFLLISQDSSGSYPWPFKMYVGNVDVTDLISVFMTEGTGEPWDNVLDGLPFLFGSNGGSPIQCDAADFRFMVGTSVVVDGDIPEVTRRLFIDADGKPVDPAVATAALGAPTILFSGDADAFATNQGTGGTFTVTGALTNASSSPSD